MIGLYVEIPALEEAANPGRVLPELRAALEGIGMPFEILFKPFKQDFRFFCKNASSL